MATSNLKKMIIYDRCHCVQENLLNCFAISLKKVNFILSVSSNNENKLKVTFQFPLAKGSFN